MERNLPDVAFFSESNWERDQDSPVLARSVQALQDLGYNVVVASDNDASDRQDRTGFLGMVRSELGNGTLMDAGTRQGYSCTTTDPESGAQMSIGGLHFTDRSEAGRLEQVASLPSGLDVLLGDINAMHREARIARALRVLKPLTELVPQYNRDFNDVSPVDGFEYFRKLAHLGQSLVRMADDNTMLELANTCGLYDADFLYRPTVGPVQLDHILIASGISVSNFRIHRDVKLSDHKPISAMLKKESRHLAPSTRI